MTQPQLVSLIMYVYNEGAGEMAFAKTSKNCIEEIYGHVPEVRTMLLEGVGSRGGGEWRVWVAELVGSGAKGVGAELVGSGVGG